MTTHNQDNLQPFSKDNPAKASAAGKIGGVQSGKSKRLKRLLREIGKEILDQDLSDKERKTMIKLGVNPDDVDNCKKSLIFLLCCEKAMKKGDTTSFAKLAEMAGEYTPNNNNTLVIPEGGRPVIQVNMPKGFEQKKSIKSKKKPHH